MSQPTERKRSLIEIEVDPKTYSADLEICDRFQSFSAEIVRLSLLGIGGFGFLLANVVLSEKTGGHYAAKLPDTKWTLGLGMFSLLVAVAAALAHRFYSSDCIAEQVCYLREMQRSPDKAEAVRKNLRWKLKLCGPLLMIATVGLALGTTFVIASFSQVLFAK